MKKHKDLKRLLEDNPPHGVPELRKLKGNLSLYMVGTDYQVQNFKRK